MRTVPLLRVRTTVCELFALRMRHLFSVADPDFVHERPERRCGTPTLLSGYTEWSCACDVPITLGWDWRIHPAKDATLWLRDDFPRSNIQLMDSRGRPLAEADNLRVLATWVDTLSWKEEVARAIG